MNKNYIFLCSHIRISLFLGLFISLIVVSRLAESALHDSLNTGMSGMPIELEDPTSNYQGSKKTKDFNDVQERFTKIAHANTKLSRVLAAELMKLESHEKSRKLTPNKFEYSGTPLVHFMGSKVQVYVELDLFSNQVVALLEEMGLRVEVINSRLKQVQGWVDTDKIHEISEISEVVSVTHPNYGSVKNTGVVTEGDAISKANALRQLGHTGKGIRIGILSDGANNWKDARQGGNLPDKISIYGTCTIGVNNPNQCRSAGTCNEGTAMAEIIHDIAPDAEIAVAAVSTSLEFIDSLDKLTNDFKADIIVDDIGFFTEPYFEDGPVAQAVSDVPARVLYVSAAGNSAAAHYYTKVFRFASVPSNNISYHDFDNSPPGVYAGPEELFHGFIIPPKSGVFVLVQWDGRSQTPGFQTDYALQGYDSVRFLTESDIDNNGTQEFIEGVCVPNNSSANSVGFITFSINRGQSPFKMFFLGASAIEHPISNGSIFGHPSVDRVLAVGAINASEPGNDDIAFYSSQGPSAFNIPHPEEVIGVLSRPRSKPDLVSIDGVSVSGAGGFSNRFFGTSAAAPHVAGVAALLMSVSPLVSANNAKSALKAGAVDLGSQGFDFIYGHGRVDALKALDILARSGAALPAIIMLLDDVN